MEALVERFSLIMIVGVLVVVGLSQVNRLLGAALGVVFWIAMAGLGLYIYDSGGAVGIASVRFPKAGFLALCGVLVAANAGMAFAALKRRKT
jgi:hypothetical protein